jgi:hypothetical protein
MIQCGYGDKGAIEGKTIERLDQNLRVGVAADTYDPSIEHSYDLFLIDY